MARIARRRDRVQVADAGTRKGIWLGVNVDKVQIASLGLSSTVRDSIGRPVIASDFDLTRTDKRHYKGFSYIRRNPTNPLEQVEWNNYWYAYQYVGSIGHLTTNTFGGSGAVATIRSRTNPSRPNVTPLTIVQDLYEIPRMLKDVGKLIRTPRSLLSPREQANQFLGAKFGWIPLIKDVRSLLHTQEYINSRVKELDRLYSSGGLSRKIQLGRDHNVSATYGSLESNMVSVHGTISTGTSAKGWGSVKWKPNNPPGLKYNPSDAEKIKLAQRVAGGLTPEGLVKGAWDLLPWSWMVDWFSNTGDWLTQNSGTIPASAVETCVMTERNTVVQHSVQSKPTELIDHGGYGLLTGKNRVVSSGTLAAQIPFMDSGRLSVLGALFVQRFKR